MGLEELESSLAAALHVPIAGRRRGDRNHVKHLPGYWPYKNLRGGASRASADQLVPALLPLVALHFLVWSPLRKVFSEYFGNDTEGVRFFSPHFLRKELDKL